MMFVNFIDYIKRMYIKLHCEKHKNPAKHSIESYTVITKSFTPISVSEKCKTKYHCKCGYNLDKDNVPDEYLIFLGIKSEKNSVDFVTQD